MREGTFLVRYPNETFGKIPVIVEMDGKGKTTALMEVDGIIGVGTARCNPTDHYNEDIGLSIAIARAMKKIVEAVERTWVNRAQTKEFVQARRANKRVLKT